MNPQVVITFVACFVAAQGGVLVGPSAKIIQGPSSRTTVVGNDGSTIFAVAPGGQIVHEEHPGYVAHAAPVVSYTAPAHHAVADSAHVVAQHAPVVAHATPVIAHHGSTIVAHSAAHGSEDVVVAGPSGTVATSKHASPIVAHHSPAVAHYAPVVAHHAPAVAYATGYGHEGEYVHDYSETLYDDGSYKPHIYGY